ncbi:MAG: response regulator [Alphaproteobacteria bacterium]|jgi:CheY-like chemotaxis protein|nr:hypothetical protein [Rhodospirillaceae bacterium]MDP6023509.1 response regulator [Alphaproteobacteria bacterium]MDP6256897.1 response regulator [Alphaproteobacteria bacterium]MDP7053916.1 response regulator [Alphaproteobacteria bacterium]MDP7228254.1 response regulator [Alphaproteobacteria bacterium]|tara:strand:+ start:2176 stop:2661 length:486 start_codon:yes stop_codon:yes gene_type:complete
MISDFSCLVIDDSPYLRTLMPASLRMIGVGNAKTVDDGGEGIKFLQLVQSNPMKASMQNVGIIFSNWQMHPIDGMMLLRWVRRHKESPNRFLSFVMVSGYADCEKVRETHAMGATKMLAKPFSVVNLGQRLLKVVNRPRNFFYPDKYFDLIGAATKRKLPR